MFFVLVSDNIYANFKIDNLAARLFLTCSRIDNR